MQFHLLAIIIFAAQVSATAADWPQWRGPNRDGVSNERGWLAQWPDGGPRVLWKASVGSGFSTVAVSGERLYTMGFIADLDSAGAARKSADGKAMGSETAWCFNAESGAVVWKYAWPISDMPTNWGPGAFSTPTVLGGRVYAVGKLGRVVCLDASHGGIVWSKDLMKDFAGMEPYYGFACSPLIVANVMIIECGGDDALYLGLDRKTGQVIWKWGTGAKPGFSSPVAYDASGTPAAVLVTPSILVGVRADTGQELWRYEGNRKSGMNTCATPIVRGNEVFLPGAWNGRMAVLLRLAGDGVGQAQAPQVVWEGNALLNFVQSAVLVDGFLYGIHSSGHQRTTCALRCVRFETGEVMWEHPGFGHAPLMAADGKLIILSDRCELVIADASPTGYRQLARAQVLGGETAACPVLCNGRIYCRNRAGDLVCLDVKAR
jgi:outer membrane protein assembly factor BamB